MSKDQSQKNPLFFFLRVEQGAGNLRIKGRYGEQSFWGLGQLMHSGGWNVLDGHTEASALHLARVGREAKEETRPDLHF